MANLNPYLQFDGNCREAMDFYREALGGKVWMQTFGESPMAEGLTEEVRAQILHAELDSGALKLMASDAMGQPVADQSAKIVLCLNSTDKEEIKGYFAKLSDGATITQPLQDEFFGLYGALTDRFGVGWMFQAGSNPES